MSTPLRDFEDLIFLFNFNVETRGIIRMDLDEAAYLYKVVKTIDKKNPLCVEIGRAYGGTTLLLLSAGGAVMSIDDQMNPVFKSKQVVDEMTHRFSVFMDTHKLPKTFLKVQVADSKTYDYGELKCDVLFIDGEYSRRNIKADFDHWVKALVPGGHLFIHDAIKQRKGATMIDEVSIFLQEINTLTRVRAVGSLAHFVNESEGL